MVIGGGDTGADCVGTAHRQGAASVTQLEIMPRPSDERPDITPWPMWPLIYRISSAHEEGGERLYSVSTERFVDDGDGQRQGRSRSPRSAWSTAASSRSPVRSASSPADLVFLAMGFTGPQQEGLVEQLGVELDAPRQRRARRRLQTTVDGVFVAGDAGRGQSLIVWAIAEGRSAAAAVDAYLTGSTTLPAPIPPTARPLTV